MTNPTERPEERDSRLALVAEAEWAMRPEPAPRPRVAGNGGVYYPGHYSSYVEALGYLMLAARRFAAPARGPIRVELRIRRARPADIDNLLKGVLDAGNEVLWKDDRQIRQAVVELEAGYPERLWLRASCLSEALAARS